MILVTGGTGFVGAHLLVELTKSNDKVKAITRPSSDHTYIKKVFELYSKNPETDFLKIEWQEADLLDVFSIEEALQGVTQVYHAAGFVSFSPRDRHRLMQVNVKGTLNLVNQCLEKGNIRLCHVSSIAAIGRTRLEESIAEDRFWKNDPNNSWYAISKYNGEREVWRAVEEGLDAVIVNPSVILGYCRWDEGSGSLFSRVWNGLKYYTEGVTGWVDVKDVVSAMIGLMNADVKGERYIISSENLSYREVFDMIAEAMHKPKPSVKATHFLSNMVWRMEKVRTSLTGKAPLITRETARTAQLKCYYENKKYHGFSGRALVPVKETIQRTVALFLKEHS